MHKLLLTFLAILLYTIGQAQLLNNSLAPDFTATDLDGTEHNLYDLLDQGYGVVIDISATWCGPCWDYHEKGILDDVWEEYGPEGTNELYVFMIEGDSNTDLADLEGTGDRTKGDWITGTDYPIIDDSSVRTLFEITHYPSFFYVCPNRTLRKVERQFKASDYHAFADDCIELVGENNAGILSYNGFEGTSCSEVNLLPSINVQNRGKKELNNFTAEMYVNGYLEQSKNWEGVLTDFEDIVIYFDGFRTGTTDLSFEINNINDNTDQDPSDNTISAEIVQVPLVADSFLILEIHTDLNGYETYWEIKGSSSVPIAKGGNEKAGTGENTLPSDPGAYKAHTFYEEKITLDREGCLNLTFDDAGRDGMCCDRGEGGFALKDSDGNILIEGGEFRSFVRHEFYVDFSLEKNLENGVSNLQAYPNPVNDELIIEFEIGKLSQLSIQVVNILGQDVYTDTDDSIPPGKNRKRIDLSTCLPGTYFIFLETQNGIVQHKIIKN